MSNTAGTTGHEDKVSTLEEVSNGKAVVLETTLGVPVLRHSVKVRS